MPRIPVTIGQENRVKVITAFGGRDIPVLALNATNLVGGAATASSLKVEGKSEFVGFTTFNDSVSIRENFEVSGLTTFIGDVTFKGGTIGLGDSPLDNIVFTGDVNSNILPNLDDTYDLGSPSQQWRNAYINGLLDLDNIIITGIATIQAGVGNTYGIAYFGPNAEVVSTATPSVGIQTTNLLLTVDENNIPVWTDSIDGGFY